MERTIRKSATILAVTMMMSSLLAACSGSNNTPDNTKQNAGATPNATSNNTKEEGEGSKQEPEKKEPVELNFWTISLSPNFDDYINGRIKVFEDQNPGITVKWTDLPYGAMENKLLTSIAGG